MRPKLTDFNPSPQKNSNGNTTISLTVRYSFLFVDRWKSEELLNFQRSDLDEKFGTEKKRRSVHAMKRNTIETGVLQAAVSAAREQVNIQAQESDVDKSDNHNISVLDDQDQDGSIPKPNYAAEKPEDVFNLDEGLFFFERKNRYETEFSREKLSHKTIFRIWAIFVIRSSMRTKIKYRSGQKTELIRRSFVIKWENYRMIIFNELKWRRKFFIFTIWLLFSNVQCSNVCPEVRNENFERFFIDNLCFSSEPFPDDAPRPLHEKALQIYALTNINERTRKKDKYSKPLFLIASPLRSTHYTEQYSIPPRDLCWFRTLFVWFWLWTLFSGPGCIFHFQWCEPSCVLSSISLLTDYFWLIRTFFRVYIEKESEPNQRKETRRFDIVVWVTGLKYLQHETRIENKHILFWTKEDLRLTKPFLNDQFIYLNGFTRYALCSQ